MPVYQDAFNAAGQGAQPNIDRARGGKLKITLNIPSKTYQGQGAWAGTIKTAAMSVTLEIDLEELPLVNVAGYKVEETQVGPDNIPYPYGNTTYNKNFG